MELFEFLVCPEDRVRLIVVENGLGCPLCKKVYPVKEGIPVFIQ